MSGTVLLLDADIVAYKLAATSQRSYQFPGMDEKSTAVDDFEDLPERIDAEVSDLCKALDTDKVIVCLSCPTSENWRLGVLPTYKSNRANTVRPEHLQAVKDYLEAEYPSYRRPTLEADDIMGILSTMQGLPKNLLAEYPQFSAKDRKVIVSEDKDMKTIPGWLFNPRKDKKPQLISQDAADYWHLYQTLVGDATDGYSGAPGIGPKKAEDALAGFASYSHTTVWAAVVAEYQRAYTKKTRYATAANCRAVREGFEVGGYELRGPVSYEEAESYALVQARVARICRNTDYDFKNKEVRLWTPN